MVEGCTVTMKILATSELKEVRQLRLKAGSLFDVNGQLLLRIISTFPLQSCPFVTDLAASASNRS